MRLALCGSTALYMTRAMRLGLLDRQDGAVREPLCLPDPGHNRRRFTAKLLKSVRIGGTLPLPLDRPLEIAVPAGSKHLQSSLFVTTVYGHRIPQSSFVPLGDGFQVSSPELLFVEMAQVMPFFNLVLLGCELCGTYTRNPSDPMGGEVVFGVPPVTNVEAIRTFARSCRNLVGIARAREALRYVMDNAWSPMEAVVATLANLPPEHFGYGLGPVVLNERVSVSAAASHTTRLPDMMLGGTTTGLNYDGENHLELSAVVDSAIHSAAAPGDGQLAKALEQSIQAVREKYVDDRRRDRELLASGRDVLVVTYEDLVERGGLDRVMSLAMDSMERTGGLDLSAQRSALRSLFLRDRRQELVWSALSGELGKKARRHLVERRRRERASRHVCEYQIRLQPVSRGVARPVSQGVSQILQAALCRKQPFSQHLVSRLRDIPAGGAT